MSDEWKWPYSHNEEPLPEIDDEVPFLGDGEFYLLCTRCKQPIDFDTESCSLFLGKAGRGQKSGRPMIVADPVVGDVTADLHLECIIDYVIEDIGLEYIDEEETIDIYCAGCDAKLSGDYDQSTTSQPTRASLG